jgi:hypothetical protein
VSVAITTQSKVVFPLVDQRVSEAIILATGNCYGALKEIAAEGALLCFFSSNALLRITLLRIGSSVGLISQRRLGLKMFFFLVLQP